MEAPKKLLSAEFIILNLITAIAFCNLSIFYGFYNYLLKLGIPAAWCGFLLALEPLTAFVLRPFISYRLHFGNAPKIIILSLLTLSLALVCYRYATTIPSLIILRIVNGAGLVGLVSGVVALLVFFIPRDKSGQGYGVFAVMTLLPYAVMPFVVEHLLPGMKNEAEVYAMVGIFTLPVLIPALYQARRCKAVSLGMDTAKGGRMNLALLRESLGSTSLRLLLVGNFFLFLTVSMVFFYIKDFVSRAGFGDVRLFFAISTQTTILVRIFFSRSFDRFRKDIVLALFLACFSLTVFMTGRVQGREMFYFLSAAYGGCLGVVIPLLNACVFDISPGQSRGFNTNIMLLAMDGGFFSGTFLGGWMLGLGIASGGFFGISAGFVAIACMSILAFIKLGRLRRQT